VLVAAALSIFLSACRGGGDGADRPPSPQAADASLTDLTSVEDFRDLFNDKEGVPRLVLLLSPT
jgi:hypothetical protein